MQRFLIAGTGSGCGKTTMTCAILEALRRRGVKAASFKCGPDYIDPMFHTTVLGTSSHNLDSFFCKPDILRFLMAHYSANADVSVLEGVMGFYDGVDGSAFSAAGMTDTPVVLVIDCKGMSDSIGAVMQGFLHYKKPSHIVGFLFNRLPLSLVELAKRLCTEMGTRYFGCLPAHKEQFDSRHLGLITAAEITGLCEKMERLGALAEEHILLDELLRMPCPAFPAYTAPDIQPLFAGGECPVIAVARDEAFCFHYAENLDLLRMLGCRMVFFSPLADTEVPEADGLLLCGGYPELYAQLLSQNRTMHSSIRQSIMDGMPVIAECGGFLYLQKTLRDHEGMEYPMAGVFDSSGFGTGRLRRFGYVTLTAEEDNLLCEKGGTFRAHEFHYWDSTDPGEDLTARKKDGRMWKCCHVTDRMYAGFPHLYFWSEPEMAKRFVRVCKEWRQGV